MDQCVLKKSSMLQASPDFHQELKGDFTLSYYDSGIIKCDFIKEVVNNGKVFRYPSYLLIRNVADELFICGESDEITDRKLHYSLQIGNVISSQKLLDITDAGKGKIFPAILILLTLVLLILYFIYGRKHTKNNEDEIQEVDLGGNETTLNQALVVDEDVVQKGHEFEKYVVTKFDKNYFKCMHWRSDKGSNGVYAESNGYPDLQFNFEHREHKKSFAVECKYRQSASSKDTLTIAKEYQLHKYKAFQVREKMAVYIVLGVGGKPSMPAQLYLMDLDNVTSSEMHIMELQPFKKTTNTNFFYDGNKDRLT